MEDSTSLDENVASALLEEIFNEGDESPDDESSGALNISSKDEFLAAEYNAEMENVLGIKKNNAGKQKTSPKCSISNQEEKDISLIEEDDSCSLKEDDPFGEGEGTKWISSKTTLQSNPGKSTNYFSDGTPKNLNKWTSNLKSVQAKLDKELKKFASPVGECKDLLVDPVLCMRIINPMISMTGLKDRMVGREAVPPIKIKKFLETRDIKEINWVTGGAIVGRFVTKSQKGNQYCIWNLSDLRGDINIISVFLFGSAFKEYWKLSLGVVVGILNPALLQNKNNKTVATLRVDNSDKIMIFGTSKDYGICRSKKSNGENCTAVVNKSSCEYCIYHVKQVYDKASRRPELQSRFTGSGLVNLRNKVLGKNEVFYGGKTFTAIKGKPVTSQTAKEQERMRLMLQAPTDKTKIMKDQVLMKRLNGEIKTKIKNDMSGSPTPEMSKQVNDDANKPKTPKLIDLDIPITNKQVLRAKANAIRFIRQNGPISRPKDSEKKKKTPEQIMAIKRKLEAQEKEAKKIKLDNSEEKDAKTLLKEKREKMGITDKFLELMNSAPENSDLLAEGENEEREKYFNKLEIREKMEEKMATIYKIDCKAVRCLKCNYKSFSAAELCKKEKHPLKLVNAVKRFWKCGDCSARTVSLELIPLHSCKVCGSSKWEKTSMMPEKKAKPLPSETLSIRGHEEKFVGSVVHNANINLLVPDEGS